MNAQNQLDQALEALRQENRSIQPPPELESSILRQSEFATLRRTHTIRNWSLALAAAAAIVIAIILLYPRPTHPTIATRTTPTPPPQTAQAASIAVTPPAPSIHPIASAKLRPIVPRPSSSKPKPVPFVLLPTGVGLPEPTQAMLIRTRINTSSLQSYGLTPLPPGAPQTVLAEFLVGEDGLPRAIRLVP